MRESLRKSGIDIVGDVPWGTHFCQFYQTKEDLMDLLVPYFKTGLENNEFCMWVTSQPLDVEDAKEALKRAVPDIDVYLKKGQIEIVPYIDWDLKEGTFDSEKVLNGWVEKINQALANGYDGLRLGNYFRLEKKDREGFVNYEIRVDSVIGKHPTIALCTYSLDMCSATEIIDIVSGHQFVLSRKKGMWERIENSGWKNTAEFKQAEEAMSENEEKYQTLFNSIDEGFCIIEMIFDANGKPVDYQFLETNTAFEKQTGLHKATGKTMLELVPNHEEHWFETYGNIVLTGEPRRFINEAKPLMGGWYDVCAFQFGGRESNRVAILFNDITERKKADANLQKTCDNLEEKVKKGIFELEKSYNSLLENDIRLNEAQKIAHIGNWDWDLLTNRVFWSDELYHIFGRAPREQGASFDELLNYIHPDDQDYVNNAVKEALSGKPLHIDSRLILANGEKCIIHLQGEFIFNEENTPVRMRGTVQDITESRKAEEKILNMATVVESSNDAIITGTLDGIITTWNKGAEQIYGYSAKEVVGKPISILEPSTLTEETKELAELIIQGDRIHHYETLQLRKNGKIINVSLTISPIFDASEKLIGILVIARDITRSKIAEEKLRKNEERYRIATEQTGQVVYEYDLRTDKSTWAGAIEEVTGYSF